MGEKPEDQAGSADESGFSQDDIDALLSGGGAEGASDNSPDENPLADSSESDADAGVDSGSSDSFDQGDIDALMAGGDPTGEDAADTSTPSDQAQDDSGDFDQSDIDALMSGAAGDEESSAEPEPDSASDERLDTLGRPFDEAAAAMQAAIEEENQATEQRASEEKAAAEAAVAAAPPPPRLDTKAPDLSTFESVSIPGVDAKRVTMLSDVDLRVKILLGRTRMLVEDVLRLASGSVVELDKLAGDPVDVMVNDRLVARGEVLVLNDYFCVRISEVLTHDPHRITA